MGSNQTYEITKQELKDSIMGIGTKYEETNYYFFNTKRGLFSFAKTLYDELFETRCSLDTK